MTRSEKRGSDYFLLDLDGNKLHLVAYFFVSSNCTLMELKLVEKR